MNDQINNVIQAQQDKLRSGILSVKSDILKFCTSSATSITPTQSVAYSASGPSTSPSGPQADVLSPLAVDFTQSQAEDINNAWLQLTPELGKTNARVNIAIAKINELEDHWSRLDYLVNYAVDKMNDQEQYMKIWNLLIHNLTDVPDDKKGIDFSKYVAGKLNEILPSLQGTLSHEHIDRSHIYRKKNKKGKSIVIVRFISRDIRNKVLSCRRELKKSGIVISELDQCNS